MPRLSSNSSAISTRDGLRFESSSSFIWWGWLGGIFILTFPVATASSGPLTAWLDIYSSQTLIRPTWPPLVPHHYFPSLSAIFSAPALIRFFPHLLIFSTPLSLFFVPHLSVFWKCCLFFSSLLSLCSHCFTVPRAKQVSCSFGPGLTGDEVWKWGCEFQTRFCFFFSVLSFFFFPPSLNPEILAYYCIVVFAFKSGKMLWTSPYGKNEKNKLRLLFISSCHIFSVSDHYGQQTKKKELR